MSHLWEMQSIGCYIEEVHLVLSWALWAGINQMGFQIIH
jgi:hypothetical protein